MTMTRTLRFEWSWEYADAEDVPDRWDIFRALDHANGVACTCDHHSSFRCSCGGTCGCHRDKLVNMLGEEPGGPRRVRGEPRTWTWEEFQAELGRAIREELKRRKARAGG